MYYHEQFVERGSAWITPACGRIIKTKSENLMKEVRLKSRQR